MGPAAARKQNSRRRLTTVSSRKRAKMTSSRKLAGTVLAAVLAISFMSSCAGDTEESIGSETSTNAPAQLTHIKIAFSEASSFTGPLDIARAKGFFKDEGLDVEWIKASSGGATLQALASGDVEFDYTTSGTMLNGFANGLKIVGIAASVSNTAELCLSKTFMDDHNLNPGTSTPDEIVASLKGATLGVASPGGGSDTTLRWLLAKIGGMNPAKDASIANIGSSTGLGVALEKGQISGFVISPPQCENIQNDQGVVALQVNDIPAVSGMAYGVMVANRAFADENPKTIEAVRSALKRGAVFILDGPKDAEQVLAKTWEGLDPDIATKMFNQTVLPTVLGDKEMTEDMWKKAAEFLVQSGSLDSVPDSRQGGFWM